MNTTKRLILGLAATFGLTIATAGPALAGVRMNHCEPLTGR
ncbi:hypothetical protein [Kocuria sp. LHG3120]